MENEKTTDYLWVNGTNGLYLFKFKGELCHTVFEDKNYQCFYTNTIHCVYNKKEDKVYTLEMYAWTRMVLKIDSVLNKSTLNYDYVRKKTKS